MSVTTNLHLEFVDEALRLVRDAEAQGIHLRILGSIAYRIQCPNHIHLFEQMARVLTDVDFGGYKKENQKIREFLMKQGYVPDDGVYHLSEGSRHIYLHPETNLNIDVFADELYFCHKIPFKGRLEIDTPTICTTDLLLEKMQIVEINLKDFKDTIVLLLEHAPGSAKDSNKLIDMPYILDIMTKDWGFYYTFTTNLKRVPEFIKEFPAITPEQADTLRRRVDQILQAIENAPKSMGWKIRSKIGTRKLWYQEVSEKTRQM